MTRTATETGDGADCRGGGAPKSQARRPARTGKTNAPASFRIVLRMVRGFVAAWMACLPGSDRCAVVALTIAGRVRCGRHYYHPSSSCDRPTRIPHGGRSYLGGGRHILGSGAASRRRSTRVPCRTTSEDDPQSSAAADAAARNIGANRRRVVVGRAATLWVVASWVGGAAGTSFAPRAVAADAYDKEDVDSGQHRLDRIDDDEWKRQLSEVQYHILRQGGTEPRYYSILVDETRRGTYKCAGCGSNLFMSSSKFESGTGWPSFADSTANVDIIGSVLPPLVAAVLGAGNEIKCRTCRGHVGEVFYDGSSYPNTPAVRTGKRYCVDGAALLFYPDETSADGAKLPLLPVRGDQPSDYAATGLD